jgi:hypothetical protein
MVLMGLGIIAASLNETFRTRSRTNITEAHILSSYKTMMGIGPLRHYSTQTKYEFFANGARYEKQQLVDSVPGGIVYVKFDPLRPQNSSLVLPDSSPQFLGVLAGALLLIGTGLTLHTWKPIAFFRSRSARQVSK